MMRRNEAIAMNKERVKMGCLDGVTAETLHRPLFKMKILLSMKELYISQGGLRTMKRSANSLLRVVELLDIPKRVHLLHLLKNRRYLSLTLLTLC